MKEFQRSEQVEFGSGIGAETTAESLTDHIDIAMVHATEKGQAAPVRLLAGHGADLHYRDPERMKSAMEAACSKGHIMVVKILLDIGAAPDEGHCKRPYPMQWAASAGYPEIIWLLIDAGTDVDTCDGRPEGGS